MQIRNVVRILVVAMVVVVGALSPVGAADAQQHQAVPFVFIGKADDCGAGTFGSHVVTSAWLGGMGLPDNGGDTAFNGVADTAKDPHRGLLLSKNGHTSHFVGGCVNGVQTPAPQDAVEWTRARFTAAQQFPPIPAGSTIVRITLLHDEGTDTASVQDPNGVGLAVVDNVFINGQFIRTGTGVADGASGEVGRGNGDNDD